MNDLSVPIPVAAGASAVCGGRRLERPGSFYPPTVLTGCTEDMAVMAEETFGPVAAVTVVPSFDAGLALADIAMLGGVGVGTVRDAGQGEHAGDVAGQRVTQRGVLGVPVVGLVGQAQAALRHVHQVPGGVALVDPDVGAERAADALPLQAAE